MLMMLLQRTKRVHCPHLWHSGVFSIRQSPAQLHASRSDSCRTLKPGVKISDEDFAERRDLFHAQVLSSSLSKPFLISLFILMKRGLHLSLDRTDSVDELFILTRKNHFTLKNAEESVNGIGNLTMRCCFLLSWH